MFALIPSKQGTTCCNWQVVKDNVCVGEIEYQDEEVSNDCIWHLLNANKDFLGEFTEFDEVVCCATLWF
jgi:hypothetical protein